MTYLLDVSALVALCFDRHQFHERVAEWVRRERNATLATCSITELGLVRVLSQVPGYALPVANGREFLLGLKANWGDLHTFLPDHNDISHLPEWVLGSKQVTDGHLLQLAAAHGAKLATLDQRIPGAYLIPALPAEPTLSPEKSA